MTSLKAYRVEFIGPLTEYPGTENGRGEIKMFIEWVSVVIGQALEYELLELSLGDWDSSRWEEVLELALAFQKKWPLLGRAKK